MKPKATISIFLLLALLLFSACTDNAGTEQPPEPPTAPENSQTTEAPDYSAPISTPAFFGDMGKTLRTLKDEHPAAETLSRNGAFPDAGAACLAGENAEYAYCFFGGQAGDFRMAMNALEEQLECAGFCAAAKVVFPQMEADMSFAAFFSLIGVAEYTYFGEDDTDITQGWLRFTYHDMDVWLNANEINESGGWAFTGEERISRDAPLIIIDAEVFWENQALADAVMFG